MSRVFIAYGTGYGHTERISQRIAEILTAAGHEVQVRRGDQLAPGFSLTDYDAIVVAASVRYGRHQRYIRDFVRRYAARLNLVPSAFVSVCGAMAESSPQGVELAQQYVQKFLRETGWRPWTARSFGGDLPYTRYKPLTRWMMQLISRRTGRPTDTSRDYDFTDWAMVDGFGRELVDRLAANPTTAAAAAPAPADVHR